MVNYSEDLFLKQERKVYSKIELLDFGENMIREIQGLVTSGNISIDSSSSIRRTLSLILLVSEDETEFDKDININNKLRVFIGLEESKDNIVWFQVGVFVPTEVQIIHNLEGTSLNLTAMDKMCLLTGEVGGQTETPMDYGGYDDIASDGSRVYKPICYFDIIKNVVSQFGGENPGKVLINDVDLYGKKVYKLKSKCKELTAKNENGETVIIRENDNFYRYFLLGPQNEEELTKDSGSPLSEVLEDIKSKLGNYEYFYDIYGNFIFQEMRNFINTSYVPIYALSEQNYMPNFNNSTYIYDFIDKNIIQDYNNVPDIKGIKNNFYVYGKDGVFYHVAIDKKPVFENSCHPWQYEVVRQGDRIKEETGSTYLLPRWYEELKTFFVYDPKTKQGIYKVDNEDTPGMWLDKDGTFTQYGNPLYWNYYFDIIDEGSYLGKFSIDRIGKRTIVENDDNILDLYYPPTIDRVIFTESEVGSWCEEYQYAVEQNQPYYVIKDSDLSNIDEVSRGSTTCWDKLRNLIYLHTSYNEVVTVNALPLYFLDVNNKILMQDLESNVSGDYFINTISMPLGTDGLMNLSAIKVNSRI